MSFYDLIKTGQIQGPGNDVDAALSTGLSDVTARLAKTYVTDASAGNVSATLVASDMIKGVLTSTPTGAITLTTPTAALLVAADIMYGEVDRGYQVSIINLGSAAITLAAGAGVTLIGSAVVASTSSATFRVRYTNVTAAAEAVKVYRL